MAKPHTDPWERALTRLEKHENGCWEWTSYVNKRGYAQVWGYGKKLSVHRLSYERHKGPIPDGYDIDHLCRNRRCSNPDHLEAVTRKENIVRGLSGSMVTVCAQGHDYSDENTYIKPNGTRGCRTCKRERNRVAAARRRAARRLTTTGR